MPAAELFSANGHQSIMALSLLVEGSSMSKRMLNDVKIAVASDSLQQRTNLRKVMDESGLNVVLSEPLTRLFLRKLEKSAAEVLLLDLHDETDHDDELIHELLDSVEIPVIFNDVTALTVNEPANNPKWHHTLMRKIAESTGIGEWQAEAKKQPVQDSKVVSTVKKRPAHRIARNVWVLGASLGGPEAVKRFLRALPADIPATFILTQHLGANFVGLLAEQLDRVSDLNVMSPREGHVLLHQEVIVAPVGERLRINPIGNIELDELEEETAYTPSIDLVVSDMAKRYGKRSGAIIFSGMGDDGRIGCQQMREHGGQVWLQNAESCVISSMPDNVRSVCPPDYTGNPEQLARQLVNYLTDIGEY
jgi:chemosensory pili system protein ChpB (putative protein-glutamate methylesterase)